MNSQSQSSSSSSSSSSLSSSLLSKTKQVVDIINLPDYYPGICIPRLFPNITVERIGNVFSELNIGEIIKIDMVNTDKEDARGNKFKMAFVHIKWNYTKSADKVRIKLLNGEEVKLIYDEPWFWKIFMNKKVVITQKKKSITRSPPTKPVLMFNEELSCSSPKINQPIIETLHQLSFETPTVGVDEKYVKDEKYVFEPNSDDD